jgi:NADH:ubiquinone oxidoreductase subunit E
MSTDLREILRQHPGAGRDALIPILQQIQDDTGFLSRADMGAVARHLHVSAAKVYGVASFYNQFRFQPPGRHRIQLCRGTACHVKGSSPLLESLERELKIRAGQTTEDGEFSIEVVACIGACGLAPVIAIDGEFHAAVTIDRLSKIVRGYRQRAATAAAVQADPPPPPAPAATSMEVAP